MKSMVSNPFIQKARSIEVRVQDVHEQDTLDQKSPEGFDSNDSKVFFMPFRWVALACLIAIIALSIFGWLRQFSRNWFLVYLALAIFPLLALLGDLRLSSRAIKGGKTDEIERDKLPQMQGFLRHSIGHYFKDTNSIIQKALEIIGGMGRSHEVAQLTKLLQILETFIASSYLIPAGILGKTAGYVGSTSTKQLNQALPRFRRSVQLLVDELAKKEQNKVFNRLTDRRENRTVVRDWVEKFCVKVKVEGWCVERIPKLSPVVLVAIFHQLIGNSVSALAKKHERLYLQTSTDIQDYCIWISIDYKNGNLFFIIDDNGIGLSKKHLEEINSAIRNQDISKEPNKILEEGQKIGQILNKKKRASMGLLTTAACLREFNVLEPVLLLSSPETFGSLKKRTRVVVNLGTDPEVEF